MITTGSELIKFTIVKFTTTMPTRSHVLYHLFFLNNNGFRWNSNGSIDLTNLSNEEPLVFDRGILNLYEQMKEEYKDLKISAFNKKIDVEIDFKKQYFDFIEENIDDITTTDFTFFDSNKPPVCQLHNIMSDSVLFFRSPKKLLPEWHFLMTEAAKDLVSRYEAASYTKVTNNYYDESNWINVFHLDIVHRIHSHLNNLLVGDK